MTGIPVVVIGGYLGAGKTTLVNHLLRPAGGRRIAVLVNDFGAINIDADLITGADGELLSLAGGCICCSFGSDLVGALLKLPLREPPPDVVVIETSGVALPGAVARSARLAQGLEVGAVVVLADAEVVRQHATDSYVGDTVRQQLREADLVLLNKADCIAEADCSALATWLADAAGGAQVLACSQAAVPPELVLGWRRAGAHEVGAASGDTPPQSGPARPVDAIPSWVDRPLQVTSVDASQRFASRQMVLPADTDLQQLAAALAAEDSGVWRAKGLVVDPQGQGWSIQVVGRRWQVSPAVVREGPGRLVLIGRRGVVDAPGFSLAGWGAAVMKLLP